MRILISIIGVSCLLTQASAADAPAVSTIVQNMREALDPARPSTRKLTMRISSEHGEAAQWLAGQARKKRGDGNWMLTVMLQPENVKGIAFLVRQGGNADEQWTYLPAARRVRKIIPMQKYQAFLNSDFTYADLGFVSRSPTYELLGTEQRKGVRAYKVQEVPHEQWYYSRILTWVASDSWLPLRREFYDPAGMLWKVEDFAQVERVDGVPTPLSIRMEDVREPGTSELRVSALRYDATVPDDLFDPARLPAAADSPLWREPPS